MTHRLTVIGAASPYFPVLLDALLKIPNIAGISELCLMDSDRPQLEVITNFCKGLVEQSGADLRLISAFALSKAFDGTDVVVTLYRAGGLQARHLDETIGLEYGVVGQETQGFGGFASALRNIAVLRSIIEEMQRRCPAAWLVNITNPVGIMTKAALELGAKAVGICELPYNIKLAISSVLQADPDLIEMEYVGLNHLSWVCGVRIGDKEMIDTLLYQHLSEVLRKARPANIPLDLNETTLISALQAIPSPYLSYYYRRDEIIKLLQQYPKTRAEEVMDINRGLLAEYRALRYTKWHELIQRRGGYLLGVVTARLLADLLGANSGHIHIICTRNNQAIKGIPDTTVVEIPVRIVNGIPIPTQAMEILNPHIRGLISMVAAYETLTAQAGLSGRFEDALQALVTHPLILSTQLATRLLERALTEFRAYLPQFGQ
jgi:6-phospho-beta-glucosidase